MFTITLYFLFVYINKLMYWYGEKNYPNMNTILHNRIKIPLHCSCKNVVWQKLVIWIQCELPIFLALRGFSLKIIYPT